MIIGSERRVGESLSQVTLMTESTHNDIQPNTTARRVWGTPKYRDTVSDKENIAIPRVKIVNTVIPKNQASKFT